MDGQRKHVDIDPRSCQASRPNADRFRSYLKVDKNLLWQDIQQHYDIPNTIQIGKKVLSHIAIRWRDFKTRLTRLYVFGDRQHGNPCQHYTFTEEDQIQFRASRESEEWKDELVEQQTQGTFASQGRDDILTTTIGKPEHPGCVRGVPGAIGLRDYFGPTQKTTQLMSQEALRTRGSCSIVEPTQYSSQYELLVNGDPPRIVAVGRVLEGGQTIHGVPILPTTYMDTIVVDQGRTSS
ncbi:uncharacterized protein HKW66_Vig0210850 [Vigna angularis]|uniref:Uncharacterized protein n=1 Tax=Phaseolus angularis TaxID=3914 RepID=A0A8T0JH52_PHAAN|nr:uncharacterized protein HKW66_Vig0210850 [Vigna angularis]